MEVSLGFGGNNLLVTDYKVRGINPRLNNTVGILCLRGGMSPR